MLRRRQFLKQGLGAMGMVAFANEIQAKEKKKQCQPVVHQGKHPEEAEVYEAIVLGAGVAGLTAARDLAYPNMMSWAFQGETLPKPKNVLVLEASDRLGGRAFTDYDYFGVPVERGAEFIHRSPKKSTPLGWEVNNYCLPTVKTKKLKGSAVYHHSHAPGKMQLAIRALVNWSIFDAINVFTRTQKYFKENISVRKFIAQQGIKDTFGRDFHELVYATYLHAHPDKVSMPGVVSDGFPQMAEGKSEYQLLNGYSSYIEKIAEGLLIKRQQKVVTVEELGDIVEVTTAEGKVYRAKTVVNTLPLSLITRGEVEFLPRWPAEKKRAIEVCKTGVAMKVSIGFKKSFWSKPLSFLFLSGEPKIISRIDEQRRAGKVYFTPARSRFHSGYILTALIMGPDAERLADMDREQLVQTICADLMEMFPKAGNIDDLIVREDSGEPMALVTRWNQSNPYSRGGTTYLTVNPESDQDVNHARFKLGWESPPLFWAGESTCAETQPSSVHGAHMTGERAAAQVHRYLDQGDTFPTGEMRRRYYDLYS